MAKKGNNKHSQLIILNNVLISCSEHETYKMINDEVFYHMMTTSPSYKIYSFNASGLNSYIKRKKIIFVVH